jgi:hypothetical protein
MSGVTHVVLVQWNDGGDRSAEASALAREHLTKIEGVLTVQSGPSVSTEGKEGAFDWMLVVEFRDRESLAAYLPHPSHQPVGAFIGSASADVVVFDIDQS